MAAFAALVLVVVLGTFVLAGCTKAGEFPKDAMAVVGDHVITQGQFDAKVAEIEKQYAGQVPTKDQAEAYKDFQVKVLNYLVEMDIVRQQAAKMNITVTDEDIEEQIEGLKQWFFGDETAFQEALKQQNLTLEALKANLMEQEIARRVFNEVTKDATVTAAQIQTYYDAHKDAYTIPETRLTRHILFMPKNSRDPSAAPTEADWATALALAEKVRKEIQNGADFAEMAKQYSDDPVSKERGGELGQLAQDGSMVKEFENAVFSLKEFEVSQPVKTQYGYHLIQVTDIQEGRVQTLDEVKAQVEQAVLQEEKRRIWDEWLSRIKRELNVQYRQGFEPPATTTTSLTTDTVPASTTSTQKQ